MVLKVSCGGNFPERLLISRRSILKVFKQFIRNVGYFPEGAIQSDLGHIRGKLFFSPPKGVGLHPGEEVGMLESPGEIFFSNSPFSPCHPTPRLSCALRTRCIFEHISWLSPHASHPHRANHCPQVPLFFLQFSQLLPGGKRYQLKPCCTPKSGRGYQWPRAHGRHC